MTTPAVEAFRPGYSPEEITTSEPTRTARLKWAIAVNESLPVGHMVNAVACVAASTGTMVEGLVADGGPDASGHQHPGLPWAGCTVLAASSEQLDALLTRATAASDTVLVIDMPAAAQTHRTYDDYLVSCASSSLKKSAE